MKAVKTKNGAAISTGFGVLDAARRGQRGKTRWVVSLPGSLALIVEDNFERVLERVGVPVGVCAFVAFARSAS